MDFPPFELLHWFEGTEGKEFVNVSHSEILGFRFHEFGRELPDLNLGEAVPRGTPQLRSVIGAQHRTWPDQVLVCNGASEGNFLVQAALLSPGDEAIAEVPLYPPMRDSLVGLGASVKRVHRLAAEKWRLDLDELERTITAKTKLLVLTNANNPTNALLTAKDLKRIADLAEAHHFHVHIDETFRELAFQETPPTAVSFGPRFVVTSTLTKSFGLGGLRLGWILGAPDVIERVKAVKDYTSICPNRVSEEIALWALERKDGFLARAKRICDANRPILRAWLERNPGVACFLPDYGNLCFPRLAVSANALADKLKEQYKVVVAPGRFFGMDEHVRLGYGEDGATLEKGLARLDMAMHGLARAAKPA